MKHYTTLHGIAFAWHGISGSSNCILSILLATADFALFFFFNPPPPPPHAFPVRNCLPPHPQLTSLFDQKLPKCLHLPTRTQTKNWRGYPPLPLLPRCLPLPCSRVRIVLAIVQPVRTRIIHPPPNFTRHRLQYSPCHSPLGTKINVWGIAWSSGTSSSLGCASLCFP